MRSTNLSLTIYALLCFIGVNFALSQPVPPSTELKQNLILPQPKDGNNDAKIGNYAAEASQRNGLDKNLTSNSDATLSNNSANKASSNQVPTGEDSITNNVKIIVNEALNKNPLCQFLTIKQGSLGLEITTYTTASIACNMTSYNLLTISGIRASLTTKLNNLKGLERGGIMYGATSIAYTEYVSEYVDVGSLRFTPTLYTSIPLGKFLDNFFLKSTKDFVKVPYEPYESIQRTNYVWYKNKTILKIITPTGESFVATHFNRDFLLDTISNTPPNLTEMDLKNYLVLPPNWNIQLYSLDKVLRAKTSPSNNFVAIRMVDYYGNMYVKIDE